METILDRVTVLAKSKGYSISRLEKDAGLGNGAIRRWDKSEPNHRSLFAVAEVLGTTVDYLRDGKENTPTVSDQRVADYSDVIERATKAAVSAVMNDLIPENLRTLLETMDDSEKALVTAFAEGIVRSRKQ